MDKWTGLILNTYIEREGKKKRDKGKEIERNKQKEREREITLLSTKPGIQCMHCVHRMDVHNVYNVLILHTG